MASLRFAGRWHDAVSDEDPQACSGLFRTRLLGGYVAKKLGVPEKTVRKWGYSYQALGRQAFLKGNPKTYSYEIKVGAAKAVVDDGMTKPEAMNQLFNQVTKIHVYPWLLILPKQ